MTTDNALKGSQSLTEPLADVGCPWTTVTHDRAPTWLSDAKNTLPQVTGPLRNSFCKISTLGLDNCHLLRDLDGARQQRLSPEVEMFGITARKARKEAARQARIAEWRRDAQRRYMAYVHDPKNSVL